jgi:uncharacterized protein (TIGR00369 family)
MDTIMPSLFDKHEMSAFLEEVFPQINGKISIISLTNEETIVKLNVNENDLRPGNTVSGPSMFLLADVTFYIAVLNTIGKEEQAVTTNCNINFLRKPNPFDLIAEARILKRGNRLIVGDVLLKAKKSGSLVAHATFTYSVPL